MASDPTKITKLQSCDMNKHAINRTKKHSCQYAKYIDWKKLSNKDV